MTSSGSTPTTTRISRSPTSGRSSTRRTTPSGSLSTSSPRSSDRSSCPPTSSEACSSVWRSCGRTRSPRRWCLARTGTLPSRASGCGADTSSPSPCRPTGRSTTSRTTGRSWTLTLRRPRRWSTATSGGRARTPRAGRPTRARSLSNLCKLSPYPGHQTHSVILR